MCNYIQGERFLAIGYCNLEYVRQPVDNHVGTIERKERRACSFLNRAVPLGQALWGRHLSKLGMRRSSSDLFCILHLVGWMLKLMLVSSCPAGPPFPGRWLFTYLYSEESSCSSSRPGCRVVFQSAVELRPTCGFLQLRHYLLTPGRWGYQPHPVLQGVDSTTQMTFLLVQLVLTWVVM